jgi:hypothetical protein
VVRQTKSRVWAQATDYVEIFGHGPLITSTFLGIIDRALIGRASQGDVLFLPSAFVAYILCE